MRRLYIVFSIFCLSVCPLETRASLPPAPEVPLPSLIRLHVVANSESLEDQRLKLAVRDHVLAYLEPLLRPLSSLEAAETILRKNHGGIGEAVSQVLTASSADYGSQIQLGAALFPDRHYGAYTLPAGRYLALNIVLGSGAGRNWWCVVFPPLCFTKEICGAKDPLAGANTYVFRSKILDWLDEAMTAWREKGVSSASSSESGEHIYQGGEEMIKIQELRQMEVVNIADGRRLGLVEDLELDLEEGRVKGLQTRGNGGAWGLLKRENDLQIPWRQLVRIGVDPVLVDLA